MNDITFLMPCRIESEDRLRNVITTVSYLTYNFPQSKILVKESDSQSVFQRDVLPVIKNIFGETPQNLTHIFEETKDKFFHKTRILNDLLVASDTSIVYNYDVDVVYPISSYQSAYNLIINNQLDVVYPYGCGVYQYAVDYPVSTFESFIESKFDLRTLHPSCRLQPSVMGWGQMIRRQVYIDSYMWNENFISWGAEDCEYYYRLQALGYKVGRVNDVVYHLEHSRTFNSHYHNPKFMDNHNLWQNIRTWDKNNIVKYYENQNYVSERRQQLNVSV
jgi:cellulose synthase/poly-beta-1,6-N-acetylglucosamine synthase-like glycosyltransferase